MQGIQFRDIAHQNGRIHRIKYYQIFLYFIFILSNILFEKSKAKLSESVIS